jgi:hypothetical protein
MALFNKKKKDAEENVVKTENKEENSTLDIIKATMEEAKEEKHNQILEQAQQAKTDSKQQEDMPSAEEIRHAQEILARAQAAGAKGGKVGANAPINSSSLKAVVTAFIQDKNQDNLKRVMECMQNPATVVCIPAQIITSKENQEKMKQGGEVKLEGPVHINPVLLTDNKGEKVFPIFSSEAAIPDDLKNKTTKVNLPLGQCVNILNGIKDVNAFVLDPYTANVRIGVNVEQKQGK